MFFYQFMIEAGLAGKCGDFCGAEALSTNTCTRARTCNSRLTTLLVLSDLQF